MSEKEIESTGKAQAFNYQCKTCGKRFQYEWMTKRHKERGCEPLTCFVCELCGNAYTTKPNLKRHQQKKCVRTLSRRANCILRQSLN